MTDRGKEAWSINHAPRYTNPIEGAAEQGEQRKEMQEQRSYTLCWTENLRQALKRVRANKGAAGVDGLDITQTSAHLVTA